MGRKIKSLQLIDMPSEVYWAMYVGIQWVGDETTQVVGLDTYKKIKEIQGRYPEWFPWETKYNQIPKEVHEAYKREAYPYLYESIDVGAFIEDKNDTPPTEWGLRTPEPFTYESFTKFVEEMYNDMNEKERKLKEEKAKAKKLWYKHYKKYGLEYRG